MEYKIFLTEFGRCSDNVFVFAFQRMNHGKLLRVKNSDQAESQMFANDWEKKSEKWETGISELKQLGIRRKQKQITQLAPLQGSKETDGEKATRAMIRQRQNSTQSSTIPYDDTTKYHKISTSVFPIISHFKLLALFK